VSVVSAAPFNSGLLATNEPPTDACYDYVSAPRAVLDRVRELAGVCASFGVELPAAALQFPGRNPVVATTLVGMASADEVRQNVQRIDATIPDSLWEALD
jgi:D-threo-aldose 1-dehydrogenase